MEGKEEDEGQEEMGVGTTETVTSAPQRDFASKAGSTFDIRYAVISVVDESEKQVLTAALQTLRYKVLPADSLKETHEHLGTVSSSASYGLIDRLLDQDEEGKKISQALKSQLVCLTLTTALMNAILAEAFRGSISDDSSLEDILQRWHLMTASSSPTAASKNCAAEIDLRKSSSDGDVLESGKSSKTTIAKPSLDAPSLNGIKRKRSIGLEQLADVASMELGEDIVLPAPPKDQSAHDLQISFKQDGHPFMSQAYQKDNSRCNSLPVLPIAPLFTMPAYGSLPTMLIDKESFRAQSPSPKPTKQAPRIPQTLISPPLKASSSSNQSQQIGLLSNKSSPSPRINGSPSLKAKTEASVKIGHQDGGGGAKGIDISLNALRHSHSSSAFQTVPAAISHRIQPQIQEKQTNSPTLAMLPRPGIVKAPGQPGISMQDLQQLQAYQNLCNLQTKKAESCAARRKAAIARYQEKREQRKFGKKVRYTSRQKLAEMRPRQKGQFVKSGKIIKEPAPET